MVEQAFRKAKVGGSNPLPGSKIIGKSLYEINYKGGASRKPAPVPKFGVGVKISPPAYLNKRTGRRFNSGRRSFLFV